MPPNGEYLNSLAGVAAAHAFEVLADRVDGKAVLRLEMFGGGGIAGLESPSRISEVPIWPMLVAPGGVVVALDIAQNVVDAGGDPPYVLQIKHAPEALPTCYLRGILKLR